MKPNPIEPPRYVTVCQVVWEGRRREAPPYPDQRVDGWLGKGSKKPAAVLWRLTARLSARGLAKASNRLPNQSQARRRIWPPSVWLPLAPWRFGIEHKGLLAAPPLRCAGLQEFSRACLLPLAGLLNHKVR